MTAKTAQIKDKDGNSWLYSDIVREHFFHPRHMLLNSEDFDLTGYYEGRVGSPACGDEMVIWVKIDNEKISDCKWQTFGCGSAIASTSILAEMVLENEGMTLVEAKQVTPQDIIKRLGGLPPRKIHCSILGDQALQKAIQNYESQNK